MNLDDGTDLTLSLVRDADGSYPLIYGTVVERDGTVRHLDRDAFQVEVTDRWVEPGDRRRLPGRLDDPDPRRGPDDRPHADGRGPGTGHARHDRGHLLGGLAGGPGDAGREAAGRRGIRGADGIRRGRARGKLRDAVDAAQGGDVSPTCCQAAAAVNAQPATIVTA